MSTNRIIELEIKAAYQDDLLQTLNTIVSQQQRHIDRLDATCRLLHERINSLSNASPDAGAADEVPPHY